jgi:hypothetical protein
VCVREMMGWMGGETVDESIDGGGEGGMGMFVEAGLVFVSIAR